MQIKTRGSMSHQLEWPPSPKQVVADVVRAGGGDGALHTLGEEQTGAAPLEISRKASQER